MLSSRASRPLSLARFGARASHKSTSRHATTVLAKAIQLGSAKIPADVDANKVIDGVYAWTSGVTTDGANLPLALPLKVDRISESSMKLSFITKAPSANEFGSAADVDVTVEQTDAGENYLVLRFEKGIFCPPEMTTEAALEACIDCKTLMSSMPTVIKKAVANARL
ncbi:hypothetical protein NFJ02_02g73120 [Pycnococcus provasolii]|mmetsp:Transcript_14547/g.36433  ORF Transcript_14547/g.36433 Transcript_14547/m.36433 type:complete len:167 (+) Transcript_14547:75-575(+)